MQGGRQGEGAYEILLWDRPLRWYVCIKSCNAGRGERAGCFSGVFLCRFGDLAAVSARLERLAGAVWAGIDLCAGPDAIAAASDAHARSWLLFETYSAMLTALEALRRSAGLTELEEANRAATSHLGMAWMRGNDYCMLQSHAALLEQTYNDTSHHQKQNPTSAPKIKIRTIKMRP
jgi:hypothetical protein